MEKEQRNRLQKATQDARRLLEEEFRSQLLQTYDIDVEKVRWGEKLLIEIAVAPEAEAVRLPPFLLLPLVVIAIQWLRAV